MIQKTLSTLIVIVQILTLHVLVASLVESNRNGIALFLGLSIITGIIFPASAFRALQLIYGFYMALATYVGFGGCLLGAILGCLGLIIGSLKEDTTLREHGFQLLGYSVWGTVVLFFTLGIIRSIFEGPVKPTLPVREEKKIATHAAYNEIEMKALEQ